MELEVFDQPPPPGTQSGAGRGRSQMMRDACNMNPGKWVKVPGPVPHGAGAFWLLRKEGYRVVSRKQANGETDVYMSKPVEG